MSFHVRQIREDRTPSDFVQGKPRKLPVVTKKARNIFKQNPLTRWFATWRQKKNDDDDDEPHAITLKRIFSVLVGLLCALLVLTAFAKVLFTLRIITLDNVISVAGTAPAVDEYGMTNILLLGHGGAGHDGIDLTDSMMAMSIDARETQSVAMLSLPRDLYFLHTDKMGAGRVNSLYRDYKSYLRSEEDLESTEASQQALRELGDEIGRTFGLPIHHIVKIDFAGFEQAVDEIDGVDIEVPYDIVDTEYPDENYGFQTFSMKAGLQHMDGTTALKYARSRHTTSDFDRSARQQQLIKAMAEKAETMGLQNDPVKIASLVSSLAKNIETTMTVSEMVGLANVARKLDRERIIAFQLNDRNGLYGSFTEPGGFLYAPPREEFEGASVLLPVSIPPFPVTWKQIQTLVTLLQTERPTYVARPTFAVLNAGARSGLARQLAGELIRYGFDVPVIENASLEDQAASTFSIASMDDQALGEKLAALLGLNVVPLPAALPSEEIRRFTIILGEDYTFTSLQDLVPSAT